VLTLLACAAPAPPPGPRIVSLHDTTTEIVVGLGRADELVAILDPEFLSPAALAATKDLPRLEAPVSAEALAALHPTAVLGTEDVPQHQPELTDFPDSLWIDPVGLDGLWASIGAVGAAIGAPTAGYLASLQARVPAPVAGDLPVFVYDCCEPPFTMGGRAPLTELLPRIGAHNVFADLDQDWGRVSWEAALVTKPRLVIVDDYDGEGDPAAKIAVVREKLGDVPTVVLPLGLALEGPRTLDALDVLRPAVEAAR
jgi:ABC-type Fe3+-hydroxamate transport system substrate-binding protein